jgi:hypothetical protein
VWQRVKDRLAPVKTVVSLEDVEARIPCSPHRADACV